jgi:aspartate racemase
MRVLGLVGGTSWVSTVQYYRLMNEGVASRTGGQHACKCVIRSLDVGEIADLMKAQDFAAVEAMVCEAARQLESIGAEAIMLGANTMHWFAPAVTRSIDAPLINIIDAVGEEVLRRGWTTVGILGTKPTMIEPFYTAYLRDRFGLECLIPRPERIDDVHRMVVEELVLNMFREETKRDFLGEIASLRDRGAQAVVMACTEIPQLLDGADAGVPLIDTIEVHVNAALEWAMD